METNNQISLRLRVLTMLCLVLATAAPAADLYRDANGATTATAARLDMLPQSLTPDNTGGGDLWRQPVTRWGRLAVTVKEQDSPN